jgi:FAD dependent oxidoreductase TIGR03364
MNNSADIAIVGAGIAGLAHAYMALQKGFKVVLFEREQFAIGASVRNFGLLWPVGQEVGSDLERAMRSRRHWSTIANEAKFWLNENGSLHLAYHDDEMTVLEEFYAQREDKANNLIMLTPQQILERSEVVNPANLKGGVFSATEATVYSREAVRAIPRYLEEKFGLTLRFGHVVKEINLPSVVTSRETWKVEKVIICNGADFETLYPEQFDAHLTKCKLQMMRGVTSRPMTMGPSLCAGLTLLHYQGFKKCTSLTHVEKRYNETHQFNRKYGIHVLLAQNPYGDFIIGDSHEYSKTVEPFDREDINASILDYLSTFTRLENLKIVERWNGVYPKSSKTTHLITSPDKNVLIVNGLGGAGMTLSFGLAEEVIETLQ